MALADAHWIRPQQFRLDGVRYDISVCRCDNGLFQSFWLCSDCCEKGVLAPTGASSDEVRLLAKIGIRVHHLLCHSEIPRPKPR
jgi:hypothetical protein